jgi:hypothetical protein
MSGRRSARRRASTRGARAVWGRVPRAVSGLDQAWFGGGRAGVCADPWRPAPAVRAGTRHGGSASETSPAPFGLTRAPVCEAPRQRKPAEVSPTVQPSRSASARWSASYVGMLPAVVLGALGRVQGSPASSSVLRFGRARRAVWDARSVPRGKPLALPYGTPVRSRICAQVTRSSRCAAARRTQRFMPRATTGPSPHGLGGQRFGNRRVSGKRQTAK